MAASAQGRPALDAHWLSKLNKNSSNVIAREAKQSSFLETAKKAGLLRREGSSQ